MDESILNSIKKMLGLDSDYDAFDTDIIALINSALMILHQLGVGVDGFSIGSAEETWSEFLNAREDLAAIKTYTYISTRLVFDPPSSSAVISSYERIKGELEWRLKVRAEKKTV